MEKTASEIAKEMREQLAKSFEKIGVIADVQKGLGLISEKDHSKVKQILEKK